MIREHRSAASIEHQHHSPFLHNGLQLSLCLLTVFSLPDLSGCDSWHQTWSFVCFPGLSWFSQRISQWLGPTTLRCWVFPQEQHQVSSKTKTNSIHSYPVLSIQGQSTEALYPRWTPGPGGRRETRIKGREIIIEKVAGTSESQVNEEAPLRTR